MIFGLPACYRIRTQHAFTVLIFLYFGIISINHVWLMDQYDYGYSAPVTITVGDEIDNVGLELFSRRLTLPRPCRADAPTIVSQTVRKGLNNQRMWIVQDILAAAIIGANIQLPTMLYSRQGCHYQGHCKGDSSLNVPIWNVYDKESTLRLLREFGICIVEQESHHSTKNDTPMPQLMPGHWPMTTSQLSHIVENGSLNVDNVVWSFASQICCTKLVPDSMEGANLLRQINFAFQTSLPMNEVALQVDRAMLIEAKPSSSYVALHWRNEGDLTQTKHKLNSTAYIIAASRALGSMRATLSISNDMPLHVVVLGDLDITALKAIENDVHAVLEFLEPAKFVFHSKTSLLSKINMADISPSEDVRGQVDFEIGVGAPAFVGSPFSSFSALIAFKRSYRSIQQMAMIDVDTSDHLGAVQELLFPYNHRISNNPCADIITAFEPFRALLSGCSHKASSLSCPELATGFVFEPALDDPSRLEGLICEKIVVTSLFGTNSSLQVFNGSSGRSCFFAFIDVEAANAIGIKASGPSDPLPMYSYWNIVVLDDAQLPFGPHPSENHRNSLVPKMLGHRAFRFARVMIYVDSTLTILHPNKLERLVSVNLVSPKAAWVSPHHPQQLSVYAEAQCLQKIGRTVDRALEQQLAIYKSKGLLSAPAQSGGPGLIDGEWHLRDLRRPESETIGCEWFREFERWGHRHEELSFNYVVWSLFADGTTNNAVRNNPVFRYANFGSKWYTTSRKSSAEGCESVNGIHSVFTAVARGTRQKKRN